MISLQKDLMATGSITILLNAGAGSQDKAALRETILGTLTATGVQARIIEIEPGGDFVGTFEPAVKQAKSDGGLIVAAGGDGTVTGVATLCLKHDVAMGILPRGTFNYFARDLGIPLELPAALDTLLTGVERRVTVGRVNDRIFLNNSSFGLYTRLIREREAAKSRFGRLRVVAAVSAIIQLFRPHRRYALLIKGDHGVIKRRTNLLFVGNNTYQLNNLGLDEHQITRQHRLALLILKRSSRFAMLRMLLLGLLRNLRLEMNLEELPATSFEVTTRRREIDMVIDGEITRIKTPLQFAVEKEALRVITPAEPQ